MRSEEEATEEDATEEERRRRQRDAEPKTKTPHNDVGTDISMILVHLFKVQNALVKFSTRM